MRRLLRQFWYAVRWRRVETDLAEELEFHRALKQRELEARGVEPTEALAATRRAIGSVALAQDQSRDVWCPYWLQGVRQDLRLAVRALRATPVVSTAAILSLALGIGANAAVFSLINSVVLRTLPVKDPERLALLTRRSAGEASWSYPVWKEIEQRPDLFDGAFAWSTNKFNLAPGGPTELVDGVWASGGFFGTLGVSAILGRTFDQADDQRGGGAEGPVVVISSGFWQRHFGGTPDVLGRTLMLDGVPCTVIGVAPPNFFGVDVGLAIDLYVPTGTEPLFRGNDSSLDRRSVWWLAVMARLKPGDTIDTAMSALQAVQPHIREATLPDDWRSEELPQYLAEPFGLRPAATGQSGLRLRYQRSLFALALVVALVLLIACANIANLQVARVMARRDRLGIHRALGASRWQMARQLVIETLLLGVGGSALGFLLAYWTTGIALALLSTPTRHVFLDLSLDWPVLSFTAVVGIITMLLFGVAPALRAASAPAIHALRNTARNGAPRAGGVANGLVAVQVALSFVLVIGAGLFAQTLNALATAPLGFDRDRVLIVNLDPSRTHMSDRERSATYENIRQAVGRLPGVEHASLSYVTPLGSRSGSKRVRIVGGTPVASRQSDVFLNLISPDWFATFGTRILAGRDLREPDALNLPPVALVNEAFARTFLNGVNPIGQLLQEPSDQESTRSPRQIIGMVEDAAYRSLREPMGPTMYFPLDDSQGLSSPTISLSVRSTSGTPASLSPNITAAIKTVDRDVALTFRLLATQIDATFAQERLVATLSGFFGALALLLAGIGLYGVTTHTVSRRRAEFAIRMALGAVPGHIANMVLRPVFMLVALGLVIGGIVSLWISRFVAALLYGLEPRDPATVVGAALVLAVVAGVAGWLPALRAARIDPAAVLRSE